MHAKILAFTFFPPAAILMAASKVTEVTCLIAFVASVVAMTVAAEVFGSR